MPLHLHLSESAGCCCFLWRFTGGVELTAAVPGMEEAVPGVEEAVPCVVEAVPGVEEAAPGEEEATPDVLEEAVRDEEAAEVLGVDLMPGPGLEKALAGESPGPGAAAWGAETLRLLKMPAVSLVAVTTSAAAMLRLRYFPWAHLPAMSSQAAPLSAGVKNLAKRGTMLPSMRSCTQKTPSAFSGAASQGLRCKLHGSSPAMTV